MATEEGSTVLLLFCFFFFASSPWRGREPGSFDSILKRGIVVLYVIFEIQVDLCRCFFSVPSCDCQVLIVILVRFDQLWFLFYNS
jgi:hypothetical protein